MTIIEFKKGGNKGTITLTNEGTYIAVIASASKTYKTERGARNFMARNGYEEVIEVEDTEKDYVLDLTNINLTNVAALETLVSNFEEMPEHIKTFILTECDSFYFTGDFLLLYKGRQAVAEASFYVMKNKAVITSIGAGELFQWNMYQKETEAAEVVEEPVASEVSVELLDTKQLKKELQRGIKEIRTKCGLNADMLKISYTERQQEQGQFTVGVGKKTLEKYGDIINAFCNKYGSYVATEQGTFTYSKRIRFKVRVNKKESEKD